MSFSEVTQHTLLWCLVWLTTTIWVIAAISCQGSAKYKLAFQANWTKETHPKDFPSRNAPHFSPVIGCTHSTAYMLWQPGKLSTVGLRLVAEHGATGLLVSEITKQIHLKTVLARFRGNVIQNIGSVTVDNVNVNTNYPLVSAVSMIAPSPDWLVGVRELSLCDENTGRWIDKAVRDLYPYDAGTDSGTTFVASNQKTTPQEPIHRITHTTEGSFKGDSPIKTMGTFTFLKVSSEMTVTETSISPQQPPAPPSPGTEVTPDQVLTSSPPVTTEKVDKPKTSMITMIMMKTSQEKPNDPRTLDGYITMMPMTKNTTMEKDNRKAKLGSMKKEKSSGVQPTVAMAGSMTPNVTMTTQSTADNRTRNSTNAASFILRYNIHVLFIVLTLVIV